MFLFAFLFPVAILILYYLNNKPLTPDLALQLILVVWRCGMVAVLTILAGGIGARLAPLTSLHPLTRLALQAALGLGILATGILIIGATLGLAAWLWAVIILGLLFWLRKYILTWLRLWHALPEVWRASDRFGKSVGVLVGIALGSALLIALAPPLKYNSLMYHLSLPAAYLRQGRITYLDWIVMSGHPQNAEMLYTLAMRFGGLQAVTVFGWVFAPLTVLGLLGYIQPRLGLRPAWAACAALLAGYTLTTSTADGYVDWLGLLFGLGCLVAVDEWNQSARRSELLLAGAFAGLALGVKYTAGILGLVAGVALTWHVWKRKTAWLPVIAAFGGAALVFVLPWGIKNTLTTGNPLYPFFFPSGAMDAIRIAVYQGLPPFGNWLDFFLLPFRAVLLGVDGGEGYSVSIGPLFLGLGAMAWIGANKREPKQRQTLTSAAVFSLAGLVVWAVGNRLSGYLIQTRMYFPLFPAFAVLAAYGFDAASRIEVSNVRLGRIVNALLLLVLGLNTFATSLKPIQLGAASAVLGFTPSDQYLAQNLGWYETAVQAINNLPDGEKVLWIYEPRSLYCAPKCMPDELLDRWVRDYIPLSNNGAIREKWKKEGFSYVMVNRSGLEFLKTDDDPHHPLAALLALDNFLNELVLLDNYGNAYEFYRLDTRR